MRKRITAILIAALLLSGCAAEDYYRVETVVWIPVNPTEVPAEQPEETQSETQAPTEETRKKESTKKPSTGSFSGGHTSSGKGSKPSSGGETPTVRQTEPVQTQSPATGVPEADYDSSGYTLGSLEYDLRDRINAARGEKTLDGLVLDESLSAIASCRAWELTQLWSHTRPDGRHYATVLGDYGYEADAVTELLVYVTGTGDGAGIAAQWLNSDSHRESLMGDYSTVGIGIFRANGYTYVCCLLVR